MPENLRSYQKMAIKEAFIKQMSSDKPFASFNDFLANFERFILSKEVLSKSKKSKYLNEKRDPLKNPTHIKLYVGSWKMP